MTLSITIPSAVDNIATLLTRIKESYGVSVSLVGNTLQISGPVEKLDIAQDYALKFIGPESVCSISVSKQISELFGVSSLVQHFESYHNVIIEDKDTLYFSIKGRKEDVQRFVQIVKKLEASAAKSCTVLTSFKKENLRMLCRKYTVLYEELKNCTEPLYLALLEYFCSLLEPQTYFSTVVDNPRYLEAYRKPSSVETNVSSFETDSCIKDVVANGAVVPCIDGARKSTGRRLRSVIIDGSNVAFNYGKHNNFDPEGIQLALDYFLNRGHTNVVAVVPRFRRGKGGDLFDKLERAGHLAYSSSRIYNDERQVADDDRIILQLAVQNNAVVISNDQFRNYRDENEQFKDLIDHRVLQYTIALGTFLVAEDPFGRGGPTLTECLSLPDDDTTNNSFCD